jgi:uncharacterized protein
METHPPPAPVSRLNESARSWCIGLHLSGFSGILMGWSLMHIIAPLVIWLIKRADSPEIDVTGKEVLNFQISYSIYTGISILLCFVLVGFVLLPIVLIAWLICMVLASVRTSNGEAYRYPFTIRFLR